MKGENEGRRERVKGENDGWYAKISQNEENSEIMRQTVREKM